MKKLVFLVFVFLLNIQIKAQNFWPYTGVTSYSISPIEYTSNINLSVTSYLSHLPFETVYTISQNGNITNVSICYSNGGLTAFGYTTKDISIPNINVTGTQTIIFTVHMMQFTMNPPESECNYNSSLGGPYTITFDGILAQSQTYNVLAENSFTKTNSKLYPNPNNGIFQIDLPNQLSEAQLEVFDFSGKKVFENLTYPSGTRINLPQLSKGIYIVKILGDNYTENIKLLIE
jgi:hypothetical protein